MAKDLTVEVIIILCWEMNVNNCLDSDMEDIGQIESYYVANDEKSSAGCAASALCLPAAACVLS